MRMDRRCRDRRGRLWRGAAVALVAVAVVLTAGRGGSDVARAQTEPEDPALFRELVERLLSPPVPVAGGESPRVQLFPGALPPDLPFALPLPADSRLIGSAIRPSTAAGPFAPTVGESVDIVLDVPGAPADVLAAYQALLTDAGWSSPAVGRAPAPGGFQSSISTTNALLCLGEQGPYLSIAVLGEPSGPTDMRIHVETMTPGPCSATPGAPPPLPPGAVRLLPLEPPSGVRLQPIGSGGSPFFTSTDAIAETDLSVADLEAHYARQLEAAGWTRRDGGAGAAVAWSLWSVPGEGEQTGYLAVLDGPGPNRRSLHLQVMTDAAQSGPTVIISG
jgi:hypothetical protein